MRRRHHVRECNGQVYVVHARDTNLYKVGVVESRLASRLQVIRSSAPYPIDLVAAVPCRDARLLERETHEELAGTKVHGEWFALEPQRLAALVDQLRRHEDPEVARLIASKPDRSKEWFKELDEGVLLRIQVVPRLLKEVDAEREKLGLTRTAFINRALRDLVSRIGDQRAGARLNRRRRRRRPDRPSTEN